VCIHWLGDDLQNNSPAEKTIVKTVGRKGFSRLVEPANRSYLGAEEKTVETGQQSGAPGRAGRD
jgi:hypothetical protein